MNHYLMFIRILIASSILLIMSESKYPLDSDIGDIKYNSVYTGKLLSLLHSWPPGFESYNSLVNDAEYPVRLNCLYTTGDPLYIGTVQYSVIDAPISNVAAIINDFSNYQFLIPGFSDIHPVLAKLNKTIVFWKQKLPFFLPEVSYEIIYLSQDQPPFKKFYRMRLKEPNGFVKASDGIIVLDQLKTGKTSYTEYDFFKAEWSIARMVLSTDDIWKMCINNIYISDIVVKLKAEHPEESYDSIIEQGNSLLKEYPIEEKIRLKTKVEF